MASNERHAQALAAPSGALVLARVAAWLLARADGLASLAIALLLLALAEYAARHELVSPLVLPAPSSVWSALVDGMRNGGWAAHLGASILSMLTGFSIAAVLALSLAGVLASFRRLERIVTPFIVAFQSMPKIAVAPLVVIWFGFGSVSKIVIVTIACFFPILVNALQGLKVRDSDHFQLMQSLGATRWQLFWRLRLPSSLPYVFVGLHVGMIFALIGTVVAEFVGSNAGIGFVMLQAKAQFDVPGVFACLLMLMLLGVLLHFVMARIEALASHWSVDVARSQL